MTQAPSAPAPKPPVATPAPGVTVSPVVAEANAALKAIPKASSVQVGGDHYKNLHVQPFAYAMDNNLNFMQGSAIKYITRYREIGRAHV